LSTFKSQQRHLTIRGRDFHFVSYEGVPANVRRGEEAQPSMWYLMVAGRRKAAFICAPEHTPEVIDGLLSRWVEENVPLSDASQEPPPVTRQVSTRCDNWWGTQ
jgi:hypothetical protein